MGFTALANAGVFSAKCKHGAAAETNAQKQAKKKRNRKSKQEGQKGGNKQEGVKEGEGGGGSKLGTIKITVLACHGSPKSFNLPRENTTVLHVKKLVLGSTFNSLEQDFFLKWQDIVLEEEDSIAKSGITEDATLSLNPRLFAGGGGASKRKNSAVIAKEEESTRHLQEIHQSALEIARLKNEMDVLKAAADSLNTTIDEERDQQSAVHAEDLENLRTQLRQANELAASTQKDMEPSAAAVTGTETTDTASIESIAALRAEFDKFADLKDSPDPALHGMSQPALARALAALNLERTGDTIEELMARFDLDGNGLIDFEEFSIIVKTNTDIEMVLKSLNIQRIMAAMMPKGLADDPLSAFFDMDKSQVKAAVLNAVDPMVELIAAAINKVKTAKQNNRGGGDKFGDPLKGARVGQFYEVST